MDPAIYKGHIVLLLFFLVDLDLDPSLDLLTLNYSHNLITLRLYTRCWSFRLDMIAEDLGLGVLILVLLLLSEEVGVVRLEGA